MKDHFVSINPKILVHVKKNRIRKMDGYRDTYQRIRIILVFKFLIKVVNNYIREIQVIQTTINAIAIQEEK